MPTLYSHSTRHSKSHSAVDSGSYSDVYSKSQRSLERDLDVERQRSSTLQQQVASLQATVAYQNRRLARLEAAVEQLNHAASALNSNFNNLINRRGY